MTHVELARVLPGAKPLAEQHFNDSYTGLVLLADGITTRGAYVKDLDSTQLVNELLALVLARLSGLPVPDGYLAIADPKDIALKKAPTLADGRRLVFASVDVKAPNVLFRIRQHGAEEDKLMADLVAWANLGELYAFDAWVANVDRNRKNLLFGGQKEVWLIDHGHCFTGEKWKPSDLEPNKSYIHKLGMWLTKFMSDEQRTDRLKDAEAYRALIATLDVVQASKDAHIQRLLPATHLAALLDFLTQRKSHVVTETGKALGMLT